MKFLGCTLATLSLFGMAACESSSTSTPTNTGDGGVVPNVTTDGGSTTPSGALSFTPSNITLDPSLDLSKAGEWVVDNANCTLDTETKEVSCGDSDALVYTTITQPGAGKVGVYIAKTIRVEPNAVLTFKNTFAVAIIALDSFEVLGAIDAGAKTAYRSPGGFAPPLKEETKGAGPGGGGAGASTAGGGGGSYCGVGGSGAALATGTRSPGGTVYGTPENIPLVGGASGGTAALGNHSGTGGGAIQLIAGKTLKISQGGSVSVGGGGGGFYGGASSQHGSGGGSGGAILLEAPTVEIAGTVAANGGGGGAKDNGKDGDASDVPAAGSPGPNTPAGVSGGNGSAAANKAGGEATWVDGSNAPGGGGGAGRIRINTSTGAAVIDAAAKVSPAVTTDCATQGKLK